MKTVVEVLKSTTDWLVARGVPLARHDAELLLAHVLGVERLGVYLAHDRPLTDAELEQLRGMVRRRGEREPLAWILGSEGFHRLPSELEVGPGVLVPRPDTEALVEAALAWIGTPEAPVFVADVGCGSGAIGLALAWALPTARVYAIDRAEAPLATTRRNAARLGLGDRVAVLAGDLLDPVPVHRPIDWVVSNPPYIPTAVLDGLQPEVARYEPREALDGGPDGLDVYRRLVPQARARARQGLLLEVGHDQAEAVSDLLRRAGFSDVTTWKDLGGHTRVVGGRVPALAAAGASG